MNQRQKLAAPSVVERVFAYLQDNRGDLLRPVALVVAPTQSLESCDEIQKALDAKQSNSYAISNFVSINESNGSIVRWQLLALRTDDRCDANENGQCSSRAFPLCSAMGVCGRLFEGSKNGLRAALAHILAQYSTEERKTLSAALVQLEKDPLEKVPFRCVDVFASSKTLDADLQREKVEPNGQSNLQDDLVKDQINNKPKAASAVEESSNKSCAGCAAAGVSSKIAEEAICAVQRQKKQQQMVLVGFASLFALVAIMGIVLAVRKKSKSKTPLNAEKF